MNKMKVMNVELNLETTDDLLALADTYFDTPGLQLIGAVSMRMLMLAQKDGGFADILNHYDIALPGETVILQQGNIKEPALYKEINDNEFFEGFVDLLIRKQKRVFLLGETQYQMKELSEYFRKNYGEVLVVGMGCLTDGKEVSMLVNEINIQAPDVIFSVIPSPAQERFIWERRRMLDAGIWFGMNNQYQLTTATKRVHWKITGLLHQMKVWSDMFRNHKEKPQK